MVLRVASFASKNGTRMFGQKALHDFVPLFESRMRATPGFEDVTSNFTLGSRQARVIIDRTILSGLPAASIGAVAALAIFGMPLDVIGIIGIVMLIGIVKKNAIMMIDFALTGQRGHGWTPSNAIREACIKRFRPIMMTTFAAIAAALPLTLGLGAGAELRQPLGVAVMGGLMVSQVLTLFITPVIYLGIEGLLARRRRSPVLQPEPQRLAAE